MSLRRRTILAGAIAAPSLARAQGAAKVVVVGGGFAGATAARALAKAGHRVTMIEADASYAACPLSNSVLVGLRELGQQQFNWEKLAQAGVTVVSGRVNQVDPTARRVDAGDAGRFDYDRLVLAPGVDLKLDNTLPGYDQAATVRMPHAWKAGIQTIVLREQIREMPDGGTVVIAVPANPYRCPPGPYERASLIAWYLKANKPKSKVIILDAKDQFSKQKLFQQAWDTLYPGMIRWIGQSDGGKVISVDPASMTLKTDFDTYKADVANVIPPQQAGSVAQAAGVTDRTGWCPVDPVSFESQRVARIHVIGDAAIMGAMPKSAFAAYVQALACADAVSALLAGRPADKQKLINTCYSLAAPEYGFSIAGVYVPLNGQLMELEGAGGPSPLDAARSMRAQEAANADIWFKTITGSVFG